MAMPVGNWSRHLCRQHSPAITDSLVWLDEQEPDIEVAPELTPNNDEEGQLIVNYPRIIPLNGYLVKDLRDIDSLQKTFVWG